MPKFVSCKILGKQLQSFKVGVKMLCSFLFVIVACDLVKVSLDSSLQNSKLKTDGN